MNQDLNDDWYGLLFDLRRSVRYHMARRRHFELCDLWTNAVGLLFGSATILSLVKGFGDGVSIAAAAVVTVVSTINLLRASSQRARDHGEFARRFVELEQRMVRTPTSAESLADIRVARLAIEAEEPPVLRVLDCLCYNDELRANGHSQEAFARIGWWQRQCAHLFDLNPQRIKTYRSA